MKIKSLKSHRVSFKLKSPYEIAYQKIDAVENIILKIETSNGEVGWGSCAPDADVTGENINGTERFLNDVASDLLIDHDPLRIRFLDELLIKEGANFPSARAAINIALFDLLGKTAKLPVYKILGAFSERILTSVTIGISSQEETLAKAKDFIKNGFKALKIKIGKNVKEEIEIIDKLQHEIGKDIKIRLDANQGYELGDAFYLLEQLKKRNLVVEILEQPTRANQIYALKQITMKSHIPIMADESVLNLNDAMAIAEEYAAHLLNIKLMKCGGIIPAQDIHTLARACGLATMVGCNDESRISISAALHFALSSPNVKFADLDGHLDLENDVASGGVHLKNGYLYPDDKPGFGLKVNM
jgi:L-alanine-DL-glutamate epimerase-like enolase superfamily enzyme